MAEKICRPADPVGDFAAASTNDRFEEKVPLG
jgi:hypothetical protein